VTPETRELPHARHFCNDSHKAKAGQATIHSLLPL
jgi:hypothetical protein